jgi:FkbM family methyltransferase
MTLSHVSRRIGNVVYRHGFTFYRPLYGAFKSYADRAERRLLTRYLSHGSVVVDAGANIGVYAAFLAQRVGSAGVVHAFEPSEENFRRLRDAVAHLPNVRANQLAVSDHTGASLLYLSDQLNVDHRAYPTVGDLRRTVAIRSTTLDQYFEVGARVDLIKLDIQGFELHALRGASRVLNENPDVVLLVELWPYGLRQAGVSGEALVSFLRERGFGLFQPGRNGLLKRDLPLMLSSEEGHYFNLFAQRNT